MEKVGVFYGHSEYITTIWYILWPLLSFGIFYGHYCHLVYFMDIWYILWPFGIFYGHLVYFMAIWYILWPFGNLVGILYILWPFGNLVAIRLIFPRFGILCQEKSGNPVAYLHLCMYLSSRVYECALIFCISSDFASAEIRKGEKLKTAINKSWRFVSR
jgi:hypothetical protein